MVADTDPREVRFGSERRAMRSFASLLLLCLLALPSLAQDRALSDSFPLSVGLPSGWESFQGDSKTPGEVLFLQSPKSGELDALVTFSAHKLPPDWSDIPRRENFLMTVHKYRVRENQALTLGGAKGHKWVYEAPVSNGDVKLHYRLYLALPATVGPKRLLVMQGLGPVEQAEPALQLFNEMARSLSWSRE